MTPPHALHRIPLQPPNCTSYSCAAPYLVGSLFTLERFMKFLTRIFFCILFFAVNTGAFAGEMSFSQKAFDELRAAGKPVAVHIHASWCEVCKKQAGIVSELMAEPRFKDLTVLRADYDNEKALMQSLNVAHRSSFIVFKGATEVGRSVADTSKDGIAALLAKAL
jgi:thiol-disulfide isomerase/thioredoxin